MSSGRPSTSEAARGPTSAIPAIRMAGIEKTFGDTVALRGATFEVMPGEIHAPVPHGGHHVWATLANAVDERTLYTEAIRHGVSFVPGGAVSTERRTQTSMRLSFSMLPPAEVEEGIKRLARALREVRRQARGPSAMTFS